MTREQSSVLNQRIAAILRGQQDGELTEDWTAFGSRYGLGQDAINQRVKRVRDALTKAGELRARCAAFGVKKGVPR